jgi:subtilisin family serine protease
MKGVKVIHSLALGITYSLLLLFFAGQLSAAPIYGLNDPDRVPNGYIVVLNDNQHTLSVATEMSTTFNANVIQTYGQSIKGFSTSMTATNIRVLANDPRVAYIEADRVIRINATQSPATWGLDRLDQHTLPLSGSYSYDTTASNVNAYVIDTGIRFTHSEFGGRAISGFTAVNDGNGAFDCNGHGTHVAGTIGGATYGVAKQVTLYAVRVMDCSGSGLLSNVIAGIDWVTSNHIAPAVANMSLGGGFSRSLNDAVTRSIASGVTYVVAAGNNNTNACNESPPSVSQAITVGASTQTDARASFSNIGTCVDVFAPGQGITSSWATGDFATSTISGTSMASPHVAGVAALYLAQNPNTSPAAVHSAVVGAATSGRLTNVGTGSPNLLVYSLFSPTGGGTTACPTGYETINGSLAATGAIAYQPNGSYYFSSLSGTHSGRLISSAPNFNLYLWRWDTTLVQWQLVSSSTTAGSQESIDYSGTPAYYIWGVHSASGAGAYTFCLQHPL